jgi:hypothetical protein
MRKVIATLLIMVLFASACGGSTDPYADQVAIFSVVLSDRPSTKHAAADIDPWSLFIHHKVFNQNYFHGRMTGTYRIAISKNGRDWVELGAPTMVDMELQTEEQTEVFQLHSPTEIPSGTYAFLRLVSTSGTIMLESGAEIDGETLTAPVPLVLGGGELELEMGLAMPFFVAPGSDMALAIDFNAEGWVSSENVEVGEVPATDIEAAISLTPYDRVPTSVMPRIDREV